MRARKLKPFSIHRFSLSVLFMCALLGTALWFFFPSIWGKIFEAWPAFLGAFFVWSLVNCFGEWVFHRWVLHAAPIRWTKTFNRQHELHHELTPFGLEPSNDGHVVKNDFPITRDSQLEAAQFPRWVLPAFWGIYSLWLLPLQFLALPELPVLPAGYAAVAVTIGLYEILHHVWHKPEDWWRPKFTWPLLGKSLQKFYGFHQEHHRDPTSNLAIVGCFGLAIADRVFGTFRMPRKLLLNGDVATPSDHNAQRGRGWRWIRWIDGRIRRREQRSL